MFSFGLAWVWVFGRPGGCFYFVGRGRGGGGVCLFRCVGFCAVGLVDHLDRLDSLVGCFCGRVFPLFSSPRRFDFCVPLPCLLGGYLASLRTRGLEWVFVEFC